MLAAAGIEPAYRGILSTDVGRGVPEPPGQTTATGVDAAAYVAWTPSFVTNGSDVTSYTVTAQPGGASVTVPVADYERTRYAVVPGLTNGVAYTFTVTAHNATGDSAPSLPTGAVTPKPPAGPVPGAPTGLTIRRGAGDYAGNATVRWTPPAAVGGSPVTAYVISAPGLAPVTVTGQGPLWAGSSRTLFAVVGGLTPGQAYPFSVAAVNALGVGAAATKTG